jgi:UDP-glucose 4-epimerase
MSNTMHPPKRLLVVGCGLIGAAIGRAALRRGIEVRILTRSLPSALPQELQERVDVRIGDAADTDSVASSLEAVDHVIYTVGDLRSGISASDPAATLFNEARPLLQTLEACRRHPARSFTYVSSGGTVYGNARILPIPEDHPTDPLVSYGIAKLAGEKYVLLYAKLHRMRVRVVRCSNAYGEGQATDRPQGIVGVALSRIARGLPITVWGDGSSVRDYIHVDDVASAILALCDAPVEPCLVNLGTGVGTSLKQLLVLMSEATERTVDVRWEASRGFDVPANVLDISRLRTLIDFQPMPLHEGIMRTWEQTLRCAMETGLTEP